MKFGVIFPHDTVAHRGAAIRTFVSAVEDAHFDYIAAYDHVLGADTSSRPDWTGPYTAENTLHELFVLFGFIAAVSRLELVTGVLVLPQRQTALVAKQAADLDLLLEGRLRLGVATGWNHVEFSALGMDFADRGARLEEQVEVLRLLWTSTNVDFAGRYHTIDRASINPLPHQRPIPIWFGGAGRRLVGTPTNPVRVLERIGRLGEGWIAGTTPLDRLSESWSVIRTAAEKAGRDPGAIGLQVLGQVETIDDLRALAPVVEQWRRLGATHVSLSLARRSSSLDDVLQQLEMIRPFVDAHRQ